MSPVPPCDTKTSTHEKKDLHHQCLRQLEAQAKALEAAARKTAAMATDEEHKARNKYETFSLENSYLARGQAKRVEEMRTVVTKIRAMTIIELPENAEVQMGAVVEVTDPAGDTEWYWIVPAGGGEEVPLGACHDKGVERTIQLLTPNSPLARALIRKRAGESVTFAKRTLRIRSVT